MIVTFISECEKKAIARTNKILDAFAKRIGRRTWQTIITQDGLIAVKNTLKKTATKNTAVSCHIFKSRSRTELLWIVGTRSKFNSEGNVAVNKTEKNIIKKELENDWYFLPSIKALTALSALLHDWGKASAVFQKKLKPHKNSSRIIDPLRHEFVSAILFSIFVKQSGNCDGDWLKKMSNGEINENELKKFVSQKNFKALGNNIFEGLSPIANLILWLILSHHKLPYLKKENPNNVKLDDYKNSEKNYSISSILKIIKSSWGYENTSEVDLEECFNFSQGLLTNSSEWLKQIKKWSAKLLQEEKKIIEQIDSNSIRLSLYLSRLCMMLGDHFYSSLEKNNEWKSEIELFANTDRKTKSLKQKLDEHLVGVCKNSLNIAQVLYHFSDSMESAHDIKTLQRRSPKGFEWQDKAIDEIKKFRENNKNSSNENCGFFIVNIASTGCGKTIANAKIARALSHDQESLRFILALGLRTLTLQTGDVYKKQIGLDSNDLAVLIGSKAIQELHENNKKDENNNPNYEEIGSESIESLLDEELDSSQELNLDFLDAIIPKNHAQKNKLKAFLYKPVLVCTIDHIMSATEAIRGGKYILPALRLLSSDLIIDEIDDFNNIDLIAISRLIHLSAMFGKNVMISSATITPSIAEGLFNVYQEGYKIHANFKQKSSSIALINVDEFNSEINLFTEAKSQENIKNFQEFYQKFITKRIKNINQQIIRRKGFIVDCSLIKESQDKENLYFEKIKETAIELHQKNFTIHHQFNKKISFGVVRIANIEPCIRLAINFLKTQLPENFSIKIMPYHSRQIMLLRQNQETHLDEILQRKEKLNEEPKAFKNKIIFNHLQNTQEQNILFILIATPVEEIGRDHDFDWAIIEPSSFRSIIQLAGRVKRHRNHVVLESNVAIMQYNLKGLENNDDAVFCRPGFEKSGKKFKLETHDLKKLIDEELIKNSINSIPRIVENKQLKPNKNLIDLEHFALRESLTNYEKNGPNNLQSWLNQYWHLTALPQQFNRFRQDISNDEDDKIFYIYQDGELKFCKKTDEGKFIEIKIDLKIFNSSLDSSLDLEKFKSRIWLERNYQNLLAKKYNNQEDAEEDLESLKNKNSKRYGEICLGNFNINHDKGWIYSDFYGLRKK
jgi:CRISPR-associated endonuclease/helicase Cas3